MGLSLCRDRLGKRKPFLLDEDESDNEESDTDSVIGLKAGSPFCGRPRKSRVNGNSLVDSLNNFSHEESERKPSLDEHDEEHKRSCALATSNHSTEVGEHQKSGDTSSTISEKIIFYENEKTFTAKLEIHPTTSATHNYIPEKHDSNDLFLQDLRSLQISKLSLPDIRSHGLVPQFDVRSPHLESTQSSLKSRQKKSASKAELFRKNSNWPEEKVSEMYRAMSEEMVFLHRISVSKEVSDSSISDSCSSRNSMEIQRIST